MTNSSLSNRRKGALLYGLTPYVRSERRNTRKVSGAFSLTPNKGLYPLRRFAAILLMQGAVKKVPSKRQAAPNGAACKIYVEKGLVQWKNQPFGVIMNL